MSLAGHISRLQGHTGGMETMRMAIATLAGTGVFAVIIFWPAGRLDWIAGWLYLCIVSLNFVANLIYLKQVNPDVIDARMRMGKGTKRWDILWGIVFGPVLLSIYLVAGFDAVRFEWSTMSPMFWGIGLLLFVPGAFLFSWSMGVNPFFEKTVRIQAERGHRVIDTGPYAIVRHPGYLGFFGWCLSVPFFLGSWWSLIPASLSVVGITIRTALEDRTLRKELEGYERYSRRVRYRLFPGVW